MGANTVDIEDSTFKKEVLESSEPVLVDFWATWCAPCRAIAPMLDELAGQYKGKVKVAKVNVEDNQDTAQQYGVRTIPLLLLFKGGKGVKQIAGPIRKDLLEESFRQVM